MKEQNIMRTLTRRTFRMNKGRNIVAVLAIILTTTMFTALFTMAGSMTRNLTDMYLRQTGTKSHTSCKNITDSQIELIAAHPDVINYGRSIVLGLAENTALGGRQLEIRYASDQYAQNSFAFPTSGHMPQNKDEIALDTLTLERLGIPTEAGSQITLEWRKDLNLDELTLSTFTLCGWWEGNTAGYAGMAWVSEDYALEQCSNAEEPLPSQICGLRMMGITLADTSHIDEYMNRILKDCGLEELEFTANLAYQPEMIQSVIKESLPMYVGMVMVFIAGFLIIYNIFQIAVTTDIQFYGQLKTLGMTKRQLKKLIYSQGNCLSLLGIPVGLLLGYLLGVVLMPVLLSALGSNPVVSASPLIFIGSALFAWFTVLISCMIPARLASKISPIEALRCADADTGSRRKTKKSGDNASPASMAWSNLGRNRKRTIMVICSLTLGLVLMTCFYANNKSFDVEKYLMDLCIADFQIDDASNSAPTGYTSDSHTISEGLIEAIENLDGLETTGLLYSDTASLMYSKESCDNMQSFYTPERMVEFSNMDPTFPQWKEIYDRVLQGNAVATTCYGAEGLILDAATSDNYIMAGEYDAEKFASGDYILAISPEVGDEVIPPTFLVGEKVQIAGREFTVMAILHSLFPMTQGSSTNAFDQEIIMPTAAFSDIWPGNSPRKFYFNVSENAIDKAAELLDQYRQKEAEGMNIVTRSTLIEQYESQTSASSVMGNSISVIIALVGILNFANSMITSIVSRRKEFAMIQSIGMTRRQLNEMLTCEGLFYACLTLAVSLIAGALAVGVGVRAMTSAGYSTFHFTLMPLVVCTPILLALAVVIPYLSIRNIEKVSIVKRLRTA